MKPTSHPNVILNIILDYYKLYLVPFSGNIILGAYNDTYFNIAFNENVLSIQ